MNAKRVITYMFLWGLLLAGLSAIVNEISSEKTTNLDKVLKSSTLKASARNQQIYEKVKNDFSELRLTSDKRLFSIRTINWQIRDEDIRKEELQQSLNLQLDQASTTSLEIEVFSHRDQAETLTILQLSFVDLVTGNKVLEFSRMYLQDKKKPD